MGFEEAMEIKAAISSLRDSLIDEMGTSNTALGNLLTDLVKVQVLRLCVEASAAGWADDYVDNRLKRERLGQYVEGATNG